MRTGGNGGFLFSAINSASNYNPFGFALPMPNLYSSAGLYAAFESAGLKPSFIEIADMTPDNFRCGMPAEANFAVGIILGSGWKVFDPAKGLTGVKEEIAYPVNLRQVGASYEASNTMGDILATRRVSEKTRFSADGFSSTAISIYSAFLALSAEEDDPQKTLNFLKEHKKEIHPMLFAFLQNIVPSSDGPAKIDAAPMISNNYQADFLRLLSNFGKFKEGNDASELVNEARSLLKTDPHCALAHTAMSFAAVDGTGVKISDEETEDHFIKALEGMPPHFDSLSSHYLKWGIFLLKKGRNEEARKKFESAWNEISGTDNKRAKSAYYLAYLSGDRPSAGVWLASAKELIYKDLGDFSSKEDAEYWFKWLKEMRKTNPITPPQGGGIDPLTGEMAMIWLVVGQALFKNGNSADGIDALNTAYPLTGGRDQLTILSTLHEAYIQAGNFAKAEELLHIRQATSEESE